PVHGTHYSFAVFLFLRFCSLVLSCVVPNFVFNDSATSEIYSLSLHDALPILRKRLQEEIVGLRLSNGIEVKSFSNHFIDRAIGGDRKSTRLNSSHVSISYAVFCLKKKTIIETIDSGNIQHGRFAALFRLYDII